MIIKIDLMNSNVVMLIIELLLAAMGGIISKILNYLSSNEWREVLVKRYRIEAEQNMKYEL
jgi:hypothetical protein